MNGILTNLVNLLRQQNSRLEHVEKNQEKIQTEVATQIDEAHQNKRHANTGGRRRRFLYSSKPSKGI